MKTNQYDEIDLSEIFLILKNQILIIVLITLIPTILSIIYLSNQKSSKIIFDTKTEIDPISFFDISEYNSYNHFLKSYILKRFNEQVEGNNENISNKYINISNKGYPLIDKEYLLGLFIDKLKERKIFIEGIKKFNLVKRENFEDEQKYENQVIKFANNIGINLVNKKKKSNKWNLELKVSDLNSLNSFLIFVEEKTNDEIRKYLTESFNKLILNEERLNNYKIEDLEIEISNSKNNLEIEKELLKNKKILIESKHTERLEYIIGTTPIKNSNKFYAAKILIHSSEYNNISQDLSKKKLVIIIAIISFIVAIFFAILKNSFENGKISAKSNKK